MALDLSQVSSPPFLDTGVVQTANSPNNNNLESKQDTISLENPIKKFPLSLDKVNEYKSVVTLDLIVVENGETSVVNLNEAIKQLTYYQLYDDFIFPVINLTLVIEQSLHNRMINNIENMTFKISIGLAKDPENDFAENYESSTQNSIIEDYIKDIILLPNDFDKTKKKDSNAEAKDTSGFVESKNTTINIDLFFKDHLKMQKDVYSATYEDVDMQSLLLDLLNKSGFKTLVHPVDNVEKVKQVILPGKNLGQTINLLQETYGLYNHGLRLFFDYKRCYCLSNNVKDKEILADEADLDEYKTTIFYVGKSPIESYGCYKDSELECNFLYVPNTHQMKFADDSILTLNGSNILFQAKTQLSDTLNNAIQSLNDKFLESNKQISKLTNDLNNQIRDRIKEIETAQLTKLAQSIKIDSKTFDIINKSFQGIVSARNNLPKAVQSELQKSNELLKQKTDTLTQNAIIKSNDIINNLKLDQQIKEQALSASNDLLTSSISNLGDSISKSTENKIIDITKSTTNKIDKAINSITTGSQKVVSIYQKNLQESTNKIVGDLTKNLNLGTIEKTLKEDLLGEKSKLNVLFKKFGMNPCTELSMITEKSKEGMTLILLAKDINVDFLTMNKQVFIQFMEDNYREYCGCYQVKAVITDYAKISKSVYSTLHYIYLCKLSKDFLSNS